LILPTDFACICSNAKNINIKGIVPITPFTKAVSVKKILAKGFILTIHPKKIAKGIKAASKKQAVFKKLWSFRKDLGIINIYKVKKQGLSDKNR
jgi:hypothetical protein